METCDHCGELGVSAEERAANHRAAFADGGGVWDGEAALRRVAPELRSTLAPRASFLLHCYHASPQNPAAVQSLVDHEDTLLTALRTFAAAEGAASFAALRPTAAPRAHAAGALVCAAGATAVMAWAWA
eukprot:gene6298-21416_t